MGKIAKGPRLIVILIVILIVVLTEIVRHAASSGQRPAR
jgi:hypothetical protein